MFVLFEFWQQRPVPDPWGGVLYLPGHSALGLRLVTPLYYFFEITGRGFFALLRSHRGRSPVGSRSS